MLLVVVDQACASWPIRGDWGGQLKRQEVKQSVSHRGEHQYEKNKACKHQNSSFSLDVRIVRSLPTTDPDFVKLTLLHHSVVKSLRILFAGLLFKIALYKRVHSDFLPAILSVYTFSLSFHFLSCKLAIYSFQFTAATNQWSIDLQQTCTEGRMAYQKVQKKKKKRKRKSLKLLSECMIMCDYLSACLFFFPHQSPQDLFSCKAIHISSPCVLFIYLYLCVSLRNKMCCPPLSFTAGLLCSKKYFLQRNFLCAKDRRASTNNHFSLCISQQFPWAQADVFKLLLLSNHVILLS